MNLSIQIFLSLVLSVVVGLMLGEGAAAPVKMWIAPIGTMFINLIKMMIVPVVFCSLIVGMTSMGDMKKLGRIGVKTLVIYMVTTAIAIVIGFAVAMAIEPGIGMALPTAEAPKVKEAPSIMQVFVAMIPSNPIASMAKADILPIIIFALFTGAGIISVGGKRAEILISFFDAMAEVCYKIIAMIMRLAPIGVFCLLLPVVVMNGPKVLLPLLSVILCMGDRLLHPCCRRILDACRCLCTHEPAHILPRHVGSYGDRLHHLLFCRYASCQYEKYPDEAGGQERYRFFRPSAGRDHQYGRDGSLHGRLFPFHRECLRYSADL